MQACGDWQTWQVSSQLWTRLVSAPGFAGCTFEEIIYVFLFQKMLGSCLHKKKWSYVDFATKDLWMVDVPIKDLDYPGQRRTTTMRVPMILPHELLNFLKDSWIMFKNFWVALFFSNGVARAASLDHSVVFHLQEKNKICVPDSETNAFWQHFQQFMGKHPALDHHVRHPTHPWHQPVGLFGDDARYTLAGRKVAILLVSSVLQKIERFLAQFRKHWKYFLSWYIC